MMCNIADSGKQEHVQHMVDHGIIEALCGWLLFKPRSWQNDRVTLALEGLEKDTAGETLFGMREWVGRMNPYQIRGTPDPYVPACCMAFAANVNALL